MLRLGIVRRAQYHDLSGAYEPLDQKILPLLDRHMSRSYDVRGIGIVPGALGSFASSRIILATLNTYAWAKDIPIITVPSAWERRDVVSLFESFQKRCARYDGFTTQVLPAYPRPADITMSNKKRKFIVRG